MRVSYFSAVALVALMFASPVLAKTYVVDKAASQISFMGTHAGKPFEGKFGTWQADIEFDPDNLEGSKIKAVFDLKDAKTGNAMFDGTLPQADWFDVKNTPQGVFESTQIMSKGDGVYAASGELTLRGVTQPVAFDFTIDDLSASPVKVKAEFPIDRLAYGIGQKSDASAEWVSQTIEVLLDIAATPAP